MRSRRVLAALTVLAFVALAGCTGAFGSAISQDQLAEDAEYDWNTTATVEVTLTEGGLLGGARYQTVYAGNQTELTLANEALSGPIPIQVRAVQFRYPNGTVVDHEAIEVWEEDGRTRVRLPAEEGQFAFTADRRTQQLSMPTFVAGNYSVTLPEGQTVGDILLSDVAPAGYETERDDGRLRLTWSDLESDRTILVRHYGEDDRYVFYGLVVLMGLVALLGVAYFRREIRRIEEWREREGLDLDGEDDGDEPPPGMR